MFVESPPRPRDTPHERGKLARAGGVSSCGLVLLSRQSKRACDDERMNDTNSCLDAFDVHVKIDASGERVRFVAEVRGVGTPDDNGFLRRPVVRTIELSAEEAQVILAMQHLHALKKN